MDSAPDQRTADWREFLDDIADVVDGMDETEIPEPVLKRILETATLEMQLVFQPMTLADKDAEQNPGVIFDSVQNPERPYIVRLPKDKHLAANTVDLAHGINREFFRIGYDGKKRKSDLLEAMKLPEFFNSFSMLVHETLGEEGASIVFASLLQGDKQDNKVDPRLQNLSVFDIPDEKLPSLAAEFIGHKLGEWTPEGKEDAARDVMGDRAYEKLSKKNRGDLPTIISRFLTIVKRSATVRRSLLEALKNRLRIGDRVMAETFVRQGTRTLVEHSKEVTDIEWIRIMAAQHKNLEKEPELLRQFEANPKHLARLLAARKRIAEFLETHKDPETLRPLHELIPTAKYRTRLRELKNLHDPFGYVSLQKEIIHAVTAAVARYHGSALTDDAREPPSVTGLPSQVVKTKNASCFSGPWLIAAMLEHCGIDPDRLFYCNVQRTHNGTIGGHGSIFLTTSLIDSDAFGEAIFVDHGYQMSGRTLPLQVCENGKMYKATRELFTNKKTDPVTLRYDLETAKGFDIHSHMQVMPLYTGLSTGHLLHVGISFLEENLLDEAEYCFELGLSFNKADPDLLYYLGIVHYKRNDLKKAEAYLRRAIQAFPDHVQSHYSLGEVALASGNAKTAKECFAAVTRQKRAKIYGEKTFHDRAARFLEIDDKSLLVDWQKPFDEKKPVDESTDSDD